MPGAGPGQAEWAWPGCMRQGGARAGSQGAWPREEAIGKLARRGWERDGLGGRGRVLWAVEGDELGRQELDEPRALAGMTRAGTVDSVGGDKEGGARED